MKSYTKIYKNILKNIQTHKNAQKHTKNANANITHVCVRADAKKMSLFEAELLHQGIFVLPGNRRFISIKHSEDDLAATFEATKRACKALKKM